MNRRNFLKSIATVCGVAVVCPGELLKSPVDPWIRLAALRKKNATMGVIIGERSKHIFFMGQQLHYNETLAAYEGEYY